MPHSHIRKRKVKMNDWVILLLILAVWIFLQAWLLPQMGFSTCVREAFLVKNRKKKPEMAGDQKSR